MGNATGTVASQNAGVFTKAERTALLTRFNKIDSGKQGYLSKRQLLTSLSPTMACFPLVENIVDVIIRRRMRNDGTAMVASKKARKLAQNSVFPADFLVFASMFSPKQKQARKLVVLFEVFDPDGDGYAKEEDVATIFRQLFGTYYDNGQLEAMTHAVFVQADVDADGQLSFREFLRLLSQTDLAHSLSRLL